MATLGVGPVIIGSIAQADLLAARTAQVQGVLLRMTNANGRGGSDGFGFPFGSDTAHIAIAAAVADHRLTLTGLQVSVGGNEQACVSFRARDRRDGRLYGPDSPPLRNGVDSAGSRLRPVARRLGQQSEKRCGRDR